MICHQTTSLASLYIWIASMSDISPKSSIITDSGFWIALFHRNDRYHEAAVEALSDFASSRFVVTWPVMVEVGHFLHQRAGFDQQLNFFQGISQGGADIFHLSEDVHLSRLLVLMEKYRDLPMDVADASLVLVAEALGHGRILSTDQRDFHTYRWKQHEPFENLLLTGE